MKFEFNWFSGFRGEDVENVEGRTTDDKRTDAGVTDIIYRLQKRAVKIIVNYQYDNIANSMDELKILNIYERIFLRKAKFMFKVSKIFLPSYVNQMFSFRPFNETLQSLRSTGALDFYTPRPHKETFKQSLIYSGTVIWNNLPDCLKNLETVDSFHRHCIKWMKSSLSFNL